MVSDRKNPPFPPKAGEGWGTLKFMGPVALDGKPKSTVKSDCATEPKTQAQRSVISFQLEVFSFGEEER